MNDELPNRRSVRLKHFDYRSSMAYFVTICAHEKQCIFGEIIDGMMLKNPLGEIVEEEWLRTGELRPYVELDAAIVMPNHFHGIVMLIDANEGTENTGTAHAGTARHAPTERAFGQSVSHSLASVVGSFKSAVSKRINELRGTPGAVVWQRNYYEHVIRNEHNLQQVREYIANNPAKWELDRENPFRRV
jgi:REP element-mobilizing transposase RayT